MDALLRVRAGSRVLLSGDILTARDAAHKRMCDAIARGESLPVNLTGTAIYYAGPCPAPPAGVIGACGPTTSGRMDAYTPALLERGLRVTIGKGERSADVLKAMKEHGAVYLAAVGGAGALYRRCVTGADVLCYDDLGAEAVFRLTVRDMPLFMAADAEGRAIHN